MKDEVRKSISIKLNNYSKTPEAKDIVKRHIDEHKKKRQKEESEEAPTQETASEQELSKKQH